MADNYNPSGSLQFERTDKHRFGRIKGRWEDAMMDEIPEANERAWNQGAEEVTDGQVDSDAEVKAIGDWYRNKLKEGNEESAPATQIEPSQALLDARQAWDASQGIASPHYDPTKDGIAAAADYANDTSDYYHKKFLPGLYAQANLAAEEIGYAGEQAVADFQGKVPDLASNGVQDLFKFYTKHITA